MKQLLGLGRASQEAREGGAPGGSGKQRQPPGSAGSHPIMAFSAGLDEVTQGCILWRAGAGPGRLCFLLFSPGRGGSLGEGPPPTAFSQLQKARPGWKVLATSRRNRALKVGGGAGQSLAPCLRAPPAQEPMDAWEGVAWALGQVRGRARLNAAACSKELIRGQRPQHPTPSPATKKDLALELPVSLKRPQAQGRTEDDAPSNLPSTLALQDCTLGKGSVGGEAGP